MCQVSSGLLAWPASFCTAGAVTTVAVDGVAIVALLIGGANTVTADALADGAFAREVGDGQLVVRAGRAALGLEDDDLIDLADFESEVDGTRFVSVAGVCVDATAHKVADRAGAIIGVELDPCGELGVHASQVYRELFVDEDPNVIIPREVEGLVAFVLEPVTHLAREAEIGAVVAPTVAFAAVAPALVVQEEEASGRVSIIRHTLCGIARVKDKLAGTGFLEL